MAEEQQKRETPAWLRPDVLARAERLGLRVKAAVAGLRLGEHASPRRGFASEFSQHRPYVAGDDIRYLDWKVYGRAEKFMVRQLRQESNLTGHLVLDASRSMLYGQEDVQKLSYARLLIASVAYVLLHQRDLVRLYVADTAWQETLACDRLGDFLKLAAVLESLAPRGVADWGSLLTQLAPRLAQGGSLLFVSDGWDDPLALVGGLKQLKHHGQEVTFLQLIHPEETQLPFQGVVRFEGLEGEPALTVETADVQAAYRRVLTQHLQILTEGCALYGIRHLLIDTARDPSEALGEVLGSR